jgi:hypothetical protein
MKQQITLLEIKKAELKEQHKKDLDRLSTTTDLNEYMRLNRKIYKVNPKAKLERYLVKKLNKDIATATEEYNKIMASNDFGLKELVITIEWNKSRMWGYNPKARDNYNNESDSISGCGYDKQSTATAQILNQHKDLLKLLFLSKERAINLYDNNIMVEHEYYNNDNIKVFKKEEASQNDINRKFLGYGSGYGVFPKFEGGVGVSCHINILNKLGLTVTHISNSKHSDVFIIRIKEND